MTNITRRTVLAVVGSLAALGIGPGAAAAEPSVTTISVDATNLRGYWASNRSDEGRED